MAADALKVDVMTITALIAAAERIFLSIFACLHRPLARRAKHIGGAFGSEVERKNFVRFGADNDRHGFTQNALCFSGAEIPARLGRITPRDRGRMFAVIARSESDEAIHIFFARRNGLLRLRSQ